MGVGFEVVTCRTFVPTTTRGRWDTESYHSPIAAAYTAPARSATDRVLSR